MAKRKSVKIPRAKELRLQLGRSISEVAHRAQVSNRSLIRIESGFPVTAITANAVFRVLAAGTPNLKRADELILCEANDVSSVDPSLLVRSARSNRDSTENVLDGLTAPLLLCITLGEAKPSELAEFFHELSVLHRMVGGSGLNFFFGDTREIERVVA